MAGLDAIAVEGARFLADRLGRPEIGVVLGSGFEPLAGALGSEGRISPGEIPGYPVTSTDGHQGGVSAAGEAGRRAWIFHGRIHLYEGRPVEEVVRPVAILAAAGARAAFLTCAAGGLRESDRPGDLALITDHLNLTGSDPICGIPPAERRPAFLDLQDAYDPEFREIWRESANEAGLKVRDGILAAVSGPCYETPAEVRMLRTLGADLVSMSTVPEVIAARYHGLRVAAMACVANRGAGVGPGDVIEHGDVVRVVGAAVEGALDFLRGAIRRAQENLSSEAARERR